MAEGRAASEGVRSSVLDAVLLAPLAAPFFLLPLGLVVWGIARLVARYVAVVRGPVVSAAWWQWPWGWPGPRVVEATHAALGAPPVSGLPLSGPWPWHLAASFDVAGRALAAPFVDGLVALLPSVLTLWATAAVLAAPARTKARRSARPTPGPGDPGIAAWRPRRVCSCSPGPPRRSPPTRARPGWRRRTAGRS